MLQVQAASSCMHFNIPFPPSYQKLQILI